MSDWGVALSGGGVPGVFGHIGFMQALDAWGLRPPVLVGASAGGIVAGSLAAGLSIQEVAAGWTHVARDPWALLPREAWHAAECLRPSRTPGVLDLGGAVCGVWHQQTTLPQGADLSAMLAWAIREGQRSTVAGWKRGCGVAVSDLDGGRPVVLHPNGSLAAGWSTADALTATAAFPPLFSGVRGPDGHLYCDGGLYADVPVAAARSLGAERVLAVRIGGPAGVPDVLSLGYYAQIVLGRLIDAANRSDNPPADLSIGIPTVGGLLSLGDWQRDLEAGNAAAVAHRAEIEALAEGTGVA
ncbi:MAG: patatin-like phospholipase family protein [Chloroflexota bacterium]|nr:patatin-like phospholipase family protein [Chloroflexota bacterium]